MDQLLPFPDHNTDPKKKDKDWILKFAKAAYSSWNIGMPTGSIFLAKQQCYAEIRDYAMGRQSVAKHQKQLLPEDPNDESFTKISWKPRSDGKVLRDIAVAKVQKAGYNIIATPISETAKDAQDAEVAAAKVKIMMRQAMPELANHPQLKRLPGEAEDLEELQMSIDFNPKFVRAKDIEESVQLVFSENEIDQVWDACAEDIVDFGVGIAEESIDENNKVIIEHVYPGEFACSFTNRSDFSDITWAFRLRSTKLSDISKQAGVTDDQLTQLVNKVSGQNGNPISIGTNTLENNGYDAFKAPVMQLKFISWDKRVTEATTKNGVLKVSKVKPSKADKISADKEYTSKTIENIYKCKWVVGTDIIYDYGIEANTKRSVNIATMGKTKLGFHIKAASFSNMKAVGLTEAMISSIDDLDITTFKYRMFKNRMVPPGFDIDLTAIEDVAIGATGKTMTKKEVLDLFYETGNFLNRRSGGLSIDNNVNYKSVIPLDNAMTQHLVEFANDMANSKQALRDITGLNELTDGSTPNPKTLTTIANLANESTNNALYNLINARKFIINSVAKATVQRLQTALKRGPYDGYNPVAGRWISVPKSILYYDYDIIIESKSTDDQKQIIYNLMTEDIKNGLISHADVVTIIYANNLKAAAILLSYKVDKAKNQQQAMALQNTQATAQAQMQSNQMAEQIKDEMAERQKMRQIQIDNNLQSWAYMIQELKNKQINANVETKAITDILTSGVAPQAAAN